MRPALRLLLVCLVAVFVWIKGRVVLVQGGLNFAHIEIMEGMIAQRPCADLSWLWEWVSIFDDSGTNGLELLARAKLLICRHDWSSASRALESIASEELRSDPLVLYWSGEALWEDGRISLARDRWRRAGYLQLLVAEKYGQGVLAHREGETDVAERAWLEAVRYDPQFGIAYYRLGQLYWEYGSWDRSRWAFEQATEYLKSSTHAFFEAEGKSSLIRGDWCRAAAAFRHAVVCAPEAGYLRSHLGRALHECGSQGLAEQELLVLQVLDPTTTRAYVLLSRIYESSGRYKSMILQCSEAHDRWPEDAEFALCLARAYVQVGEIRKARSWAEAGLELDPGNDEALGLLKALSHHD